MVYQCSYDTIQQDLDLFRSCLKRKNKCWRIRLEAALLYPFHGCICAACPMNIYIFLECLRLANMGHIVQCAICLITYFHSLLFLFLVSFFWGFWPSPPLCIYFHFPFFNNLLSLTAYDGGFPRCQPSRDVGVSSLSLLHLQKKQRKC